MILPRGITWAIHDCSGAHRVRRQVVWKSRIYEVCGLRLLGQVPGGAVFPATPLPSGPVIKAAPLRTLTHSEIVSNASFGARSGLYGLAGVVRVRTQELLRWLLGIVRFYW